MASSESKQFNSALDRRWGPHGLLINSMTCPLCNCEVYISRLAELLHRIRRARNFTWDTDDGWKADSSQIRMSGSSSVVSRSRPNQSVMYFSIDALRAAKAPSWIGEFPKATSKPRIVTLLPRPRRRTDKT